MTLEREQELLERADHLLEKLWRGSPSSLEKQQAVAGHATALIAMAGELRARRKTIHYSTQTGMS